MPCPFPNKVIHQLWRPTEQDTTLQIYAILDAARDEDIYPTLIDSDSNYYCLYRGRIPSVLAEAAPYVVQLQAQASFTNWLIKEGWGESWGIFLASSATLDELRRHFRRFIMVKDEAGKKLYFRYYDPRMLRVYLPTCNEAELEVVFGPVDHFLVEDETLGFYLERSGDDTTEVAEPPGLSTQDRIGLETLGFYLERSGDDTTEVAEPPGLSTQDRIGLETLGFYLERSGDDTTEVAEPPGLSTQDRIGLHWTAGAMYVA